MGVDVDHHDRMMILYMAWMPRTRLIMAEMAAPRIRVLQAPPVKIFQGCCCPEGFYSGHGPPCEACL